MAKSLIIADVHREYVERLRNYIHEKYEEAYNIEVFYDKKKLQERLRNEKCEVVLLSPQLYDVELNLKNIKLPIILQEEEETLPQSDKLKWVIQKYTRISTMVQYIETQYEEVELNRPLIYSFYSPAGGVGQTTLALGTAMSYLQAGRKVFYINLEDVDSTSMFWEQKEETPDALLTHNSEKVDMACLKKYIKQDSKTKIMYLKRSLMEVDEKVSVQLEDMIEKVIDHNIADVVIIDANHSYQLLETYFLEQSDYVMLVSNTQWQSQFKMEQFLKHTNLLEKYKEKVKLIINQGQVGDHKETMQYGIKVMAVIDKLYAKNPMGLCEFIAQNKLLTLHGLI